MLISECKPPILCRNTTLVIYLSPTHILCSTLHPRTTQRSSGAHLLLPPRDGPGSPHAGLPTVQRDSQPAVALEKSLPACVRDGHALHRPRVEPRGTALHPAPEAFLHLLLRPFLSSLTDAISSHLYASVLRLPLPDLLSGDRQRSLLEGEIQLDGK